MAVALNKFAGEVLTHVEPNENGIKEFGILEIIAVVTLLVQLYKCLREPKTAYGVLQRPGLINRVRLRRQCRIKLGDRGGDKFVKAIFDRGSTITLAEVESILSEINER